MKPLWALAARVLAAVALGGLIGLMAGHAALGAALILAALLGVEIHRLNTYLRWLRTDRPDAAPELGGAWGDAVSLAVRLYRRRMVHQQRLRRLLRELRESTAAMPDGVVVLNPRAEIVWFNRTAGRLLDLRSRDDVGLRVENLVRQPEFVRYMATRDFSQAVQVRNSGPQEQYLSIQVVPYGAGQQLMFVRDVTRQARLEAMRKDFVANASHELRSPLTVIGGYLETLAQDPELDPGMAQPVQEMRRQAQRMNAIVRDLLELSSLEASDEEVAGEPIDVSVLIGQLRQDVLARPVHPQSVEVAIDSPDGLRGDEALIHSAFSNLVDNAVKYTPAAGKVVIRWWTDAAGAHFAVADTGIGIPPEYLPRLTERFYRVDAGRSRATGGSGLGLSIVKHVLQRHGAELTIESVEGRGSTFTCHFPAARVVPAGSDAKSLTQ